MAGFFRVSFAGAGSYASFGTWKSFCAKLAVIRVELSWDACSARRARAR